VRCSIQWEAINRKQITRWQHVSQLKASSFNSLLKKSLLLKNATAYTWDWYCHLVVDRASFPWVEKLHFYSREIFLRFTSIRTAVTEPSPDNCKLFVFDLLENGKVGGQ
jgi:hypothetical protein